jgi:hypothetical protein
MIPMATTTTTLTGRDRAILRAVAAGGAEIVPGVAELFLDGRCCCDQHAARHLVLRGLIAAEADGAGARVPAVLSRSGRQALALAA